MKHVLTKKFIGCAVAILLACALVAAAICGHVLSRFASTEEYTYNQVSVADFYFTVDILGDSVDESTSTKEINIYGAISGSSYAGQDIKFTVSNYFDDLRVTSEAVTYTISYSSNLSSGGASITLKDSDSKDVSSTDSQTFTASNSQTANDQTATYTLGIGSYSQEETITVTIASSSPFTKTLTLIFNLKVSPSDVTCSISEATSLYAELIIKSDVELAEEAVTIDWSNATGLQFDSTNSYFELDATNNDYTAKNSKKIPKEGSISVKFFKSDTTAYTVSIAESGGEYTIAISQQTSG